MLSRAKFYKLMRQRLSYLPKVTRPIFGGMNWGFKEHSGGSNLLRDQLVRYFILTKRQVGLDKIGYFNCKKYLFLEFLDWTKQVKIDLKLSKMNLDPIKMCGLFKYNKRWKETNQSRKAFNHSARSLWIFTVSSYLMN